MQVKLVAAIRRRQLFSAIRSNFFGRNEKGKNATFITAAELELSVLYALWIIIIFALMIVVCCLLIAIVDTK